MITYSLVIPHKNTPKLLQRCLESIPQREDVEVIVVDDNSDEHLKPYVNRHDVILLEIGSDWSKGAGRARNIGLSKARGIWVLFVDADDYYEKGFIDVLDQYKDCDADVVYFNHQMVRDGKIIKNRYPFVDRYDVTNSATLDAVKYRFNVPWNKMVKKSFLTSKNITFEETPVGNDVFFSYQVGFLARKVFVDKAIIYNYVINNNSTIRRKKNNEAFYFAQLSHHYQCNYFYEYVGYPSWSRGIVRLFSAIIVKKGLGQFILAIRVFAHHYSAIIKGKDYFVNEIKSRCYD